MQGHEIALWAIEGAAVAGAIGVYALHRHMTKGKLAEDLRLLEAATWRIVNGMEQYPRKSASGRAKSRTDLVKVFSLEAAKLGRPLPMGVGESSLDITNAAFETIDRNEKDSSGHWRQINALRRGCEILLSLYWLRNPRAAFLILTNHMKIQSRLKPGEVNNLTELKILFGLPTAWPTDLDIPSIEKREQMGLSLRRENQIMRAINKGFDAVSRHLVYKPWPEGKVNDDDDTFEGIYILEQMRFYTR